MNRFTDRAWPGSNELHLKIIVSSIIALLAVNLISINSSAGPKPIIAPGEKLQKLADGFSFTEGPACDRHGNVFFTDQPNDRIMEWSIEGQLSVFMQPCGRANGLPFDHAG